MTSYGSHASLTKPLDVSTWQFTRVPARVWREAEIHIGFANNVCVISSSLKFWSDFPSKSIKTEQVLSQWGTELMAVRWEGKRWMIDSQTNISAVTLSSYFTFLPSRLKSLGCADLSSTDYDYDWAQVIRVYFGFAFSACVCQYGPFSPCRASLS